MLDAIQKTIIIKKQKKINNQPAVVGDESMVAAYCGEKEGEMRKQRRLKKQVGRKWVEASMEKGMGDNLARQRLLQSDRRIAMKATQSN